MDGDATLVEAARAAGSSPVHLASYEALVEAKVDIGSDYDLICANFALLHQDMIPLLAAMNALQCFGHGQLSLGRPAGAAAPVKSCAAVVAVGGRAGVSAIDEFGQGEPPGRILLG